MDLLDQPPQDVDLKARYEDILGQLASYVAETLSGGVRAALLRDYAMQDVRFPPRSGRAWGKQTSTLDPDYSSSPDCELSTSGNALLHEDWLARMGHRGVRRLEDDVWLSACPLEPVEGRT